MTALLPSGSAPSWHLEFPSRQLFKFPPSPYPQSLHPPVSDYSFQRPFNIPVALYDEVLSAKYPLAIGGCYVLASKLLNQYNRQNGNKPWPVSKTGFFHVFVVLHNVFLALYSLWTFAAMSKGLRNSVPGWWEKDGFVGMVDGFCKIHGPKGLGNATLFNPRTNTWNFANGTHTLDGLPSRTDTGRMWNEGLAFYGWIFYISKFYEVLDTLIILAKGKQSSTLQTYHHAGAMLCMWAGIRYMAPPIWMFVVVNSLIHGIMYTYFTASALSIRVPTIVKRTITTLQITQFVVGVGFAALHLFIRYDIPTMVPYLVGVDNVSSGLPGASTVTSIISSPSTIADISNWVKKVALRAAGHEGLAQNVLNAEKQRSIFDAVHALVGSQGREQIRYKVAYQSVHCLDTNGESFAIWLNLLYLYPLTWLFVQFFIRSYLKRTSPKARQARRSSISKVEAAEKAGKNAVRGLEKKLRSKTATPKSTTQKDTKPSDSIPDLKQSQVPATNVKDLSMSTTSYADISKIAGDLGSTEEYVFHSNQPNNKDGRKA